MKRVGWLLLATMCACGEDAGEPGDGATDGGSADAATSASADGAASLPGGPGPGEPAVGRGGSFFGTMERFNRHYTDPSHAPLTTLYVSPSGAGDGSSVATPSSVSAALAKVAPGTRVFFTKGSYAGCFELDAARSGTYDAPVVLYGERNPDGSLGVRIDCCATGRQACVNLEAADHVAVDGLELVGGRYGVRFVGAGYPANQHQRGVAVTHCSGHGQSNDPFFSGQSDWAVIERNLAYDVGAADGHGIYLSNGSDWNVVRYNETYATSSADFQINADPISTCQGDGVAYDSAECDAVAGTGPTGGRGASDFFLVEGNFFHHSNAQGANFTSVRSSMVRNNLFVLPARHGVSFWQETNNPKLGARDNTVVHNLFVGSTSGRQTLMVIAESTGNTFANNLFVAVTAGAQPGANTAVPLLSSDASTTTHNSFSHNAWVSGSFVTEDGSTAYTPNAQELRSTSFDLAWFLNFPKVLGHDPGDLRPTLAAPWRALAPLLPEAPLDHGGVMRTATTAMGPFAGP